MDRRIIWIRLAYWLGILGDLVAAVYMLFPQLDKSSFNSGITSDLVFGLGTRRGAHLMIGWTILLLWADQKPVERKDILLITLCPVEAGRLVYLVYALLEGFAAPAQTISNLIIEGIFIAVFAIGYLNAKQIESTTRHMEVRS